MPVNCRHQPPPSPADSDQSFPKSLLPLDISLKPFRFRKLADVLRRTAIPHRAWLTTVGPQDRAPAPIVRIVSCQSERAKRIAKCYRNSPRSRNSKSSSSSGVATKTRPKLGTRIIQPTPYCLTYHSVFGSSDIATNSTSPARHGRECRRQGEYLLLTCRRE